MLLKSTQLTVLVIAKILEDKIELKYLSQTWLRLCIRTIIKNIIILENIFKQRKIAQKSSISLDFLYAWLYEQKRYNSRLYFIYIYYSIWF